MTQRGHFRRQHLYVLDARSARVQALVQEARTIVAPALDDIRARILHAASSVTAPDAFAEALMAEGEALAKAVAQPLNYLTTQRIVTDEDGLAAALKVMADRLEATTAQQRGTRSYPTLWATTEHTPQMMGALAALEKAGAEAAMLLRRSPLAQHAHSPHKPTSPGR